MLAGGANSRFGGTAKGLLEIGGRRVIDRVYDALRAVTDAQLIVANDPAAHSWLPDVPVVADVLTSAVRGSLVGIHSALSHAQTPVLVVAWDMPFVTTDLLRELRMRGERARAAVVPSGDAGIEGCCAYYRPEDLTAAARQIERGEMRLSEFVAALPAAVRLQGADLSRFGSPATLFLNINDAGDLAAARLAAEASA